MKLLRFALLSLAACSVGTAFAQEPLNTAGMQAIDDARRAQMLRNAPPAVTPQSYLNATSVLVNRNNVYPNNCAPRPSRGSNVTVIINNGTGASCGPVYPSYPAYGYPSYGYPASPYGYGQAYSGSSITYSTPGYSTGMFTMPPYSTTITSFNSAPSYPPAYPTYVPNVNGYRGAASPGYNYNNGSVLGGGYTGGYNGSIGQTVRR